MRMFRFAHVLWPAAALVLTALQIDPASAQLPYCTCPGETPRAGACTPNPRCPAQQPSSTAPHVEHHHGYSASRPTLAPMAPASAALPAARPTRPMLAPVRYPASVAIQDASSPIVRPPGAPGPRAHIKVTGYDLLDAVGTEAPGYGLYSYAFLPLKTDRGAALLDVLLQAITPIGSAGGTREQQNVLYLPVHKDQGPEWMVLRQDPAQQSRLGEAFQSSFYDHKMARDVLIRICTEPYEPNIADLCAGNFLSKGPYLFTYAQPASSKTPLSPPFLLVDLTHTDPGAFREVVDAFQVQVRREDISDGAKINTLRLKLLNLVMLGSSMLPNVRMGVDTNLPGGGAGDKK